MLRRFARDPVRSAPLAFLCCLCNAPGRVMRDRRETGPVYRETPAGFSLSEVEVRLVKAEERPRWDALMDTHHYLGFRRLAGRGLR